MDKESFVRNISKGWYVGDTAWRVYTVNTACKCKMCNGASIIKAAYNGELLEVRCPECNGRGTIYANPRCRPISFEVGLIKFSVTKNGIENTNEHYCEGVYEVFSDSDPLFYPLDTIYRTEEECRKKCDEIAIKYVY